MVDYENFVARYYPGADEKKEKDIGRFVSYVNSTIGDSKNGFNDKSYLCSLFYIQKTGGVSLSHYKKIKGYLINLFDFLGIAIEVPLRREVMDTQRVSSLFASLDSIFDYIDSIGRKYLCDYNTNADLLNLKTIVALGWYGFTIKQIMELPRRCLKKTENGDFYAVSDSGVSVKIDERAYRYIDFYASSDSHRGIPSGKSVQYQSDESMLIRSRVSGRAFDNIVACTLQRFNSLIPNGDNHAILFRNLRKNALFVKIAEDTEDDSAYNKTMKHFECSGNQAYGIEQEYLQWLSLVRDKKI